MAAGSVCAADGVLPVRAAQSARAAAGQLSSGGCRVLRKGPGRLSPEEAGAGLWALGVLRPSKEAAAILWRQTGPEALRLAGESLKRRGGYGACVSGRIACGGRGTAGRVEAPG